MFYLLVHSCSSTHAYLKFFRKLLPSGEEIDMRLDIQPSKQPNSSNWRHTLMNAWMNERRDMSMGQQTARQIDGQMDEWMGGWIGGWADT